MKHLTLITLGLALSLSLSLDPALAQDEDELARIKSELEQARMAVAEAAQELARLQRELVEVTGENLSERWSWHSNDGDAEVFEFDFEVDIEEGDHARALVANFPPRLGVLLGDNGEGETNRIIGVTPGSGAAEAGLQNNDRLLEINGQDVRENTSDRVRNILGEFEPGDTVDVLVQRGEGNELIMPVTLRSALGNVQILANQLESIDLSGAGGERNVVRIINGIDGIDAPVPPIPPMAPLTGLLTGLGSNTDLISNHEGLAGYFGTGEGVLVLRIDEGNSMNLMSGDVILGIGDKTVEQPIDLGRALLDMEPGEDIRLRVMREGLETTVYGTVPASTFRPLGQDRGLGRLMRFDAPRAPAPPPAPGSTL
jgi:membrane-associated protease RseP (regulator of RpoE activity)